MTMLIGDIPLLLGGTYSADAYINGNAIRVLDAREVDTSLHQLVARTNDIANRLNGFIKWITEHHPEMIAAYEAHCKALQRMT